MKILRIRRAVSLFAAVIIFLTQAAKLEAQTQGTDLFDDGQIYLIAHIGTEIQDFYIPQNVEQEYLYLQIRGGDGGARTVKEAWGDVRFIVNGGSGATVLAAFKIGNGAGEIPPGSLIRMIVGGKGESKATQSSYAGGGGGGTAVLFKAPDKSLSEFKLLLVSGGGGGAMSDCCSIKHEGRPAETGTSGSSSHIYKDVEYAGGSNGNGGVGTNADDGDEDESGPGGGAFSAANNHPERRSGGGSGGGTNDPQGGKGGYNYKKQVKSKGGYGYGGGGEGTGVWGGGGGGYSGGGAGAQLGNRAGGGGGGSFVNAGYAKYNLKIKNGTTSHPGDGFVKYWFAEDANGFDPAIHLTMNMDKCFDVLSGGTSPGTDVQLYHCTNNSNQQWLFDGEMIRYVKHPDRCLELSGSKAVNGANIDIWTCNTTTNAQKWIYNGIRKTIHSRVNLDYCIDLPYANPADENSLQLASCNGFKGQRWTIKGLTPKVQRVHNRIKFLADPGKCVDVAAAGTANGTNIQVYHCHYAASQFWNFDFADYTIKFELDPNKCLDLSGGNTSNGANIQLWDCQEGNNNQKWLYDANTKAFRSWIDPRKCIDVKDGKLDDYNNIQLHDCNATKGQQFLLDPVDPCDHDFIAPVAKCKGFQNTANVIPNAAMIDDGSYDNCAIASINLENMGGHNYKLTVTDTSGNASTCTAYVY